MEGELPDWLAEMRDRQLGQQLEEKHPPLPEQTFEDVEERLEGLTDLGDIFQDQPDQADVPLGQMGPKDVLDGLREQMTLAEEDFKRDEKSPLAQMFAGLSPGQRFVLAVFFFLDVALCGCMALVMVGRVGLPF